MNDSLTVLLVGTKLPSLQAPLFFPSKNRQSAATCNQHDLQSLIGLHAGHVGNALGASNQGSGDINLLSPSQLIPTSIDGDNQLSFDASSDAGLSCDTAFDFEDWMVAYPKGSNRYVRLTTYRTCDLGHSNIRVFLIFFNLFVWLC